MKKWIFRYFKSSNILLDQHWNAKLSDFGLARLGPDEGLTHVSTAAVGTLGYAAPEYIQSSRLTYKSDVWSYGVFLLELITGRRPLDRVSRSCWSGKRFKLILDPRLEGNIPLQSAEKLAMVANDCLVRNPKMSEVLRMVNQIVETETQPPLKSCRDKDKESKTST